jgi:hypothetical protein
MRPNGPSSGALSHWTLDEMSSSPVVAAHRSTALGTMSIRIRAAVLAWLAMLGLDFVLNGAVFAAIYQRSDPFLLAPADAFRRIPIGYLAFLLLAFGIVEAVRRLHIARLRDGAFVGVAMGGVVGLVWALSLYSITAVAAPVAGAFAVIWLAVITLGAAVGAVGLGNTSWRRLAVLVVAFDIVCVVAVIALQTFGAVPTIKV